MRLGYATNPARRLSAGPFLICLIIALCSTTLTATERQSIVARENLSTAHRDELIRSLRNITGWTNLQFNNDGFLEVTGSQSNPGSTSARSLLELGMKGRNIIVVEDASSRGDVAFCRVVPGRWKSGERLESVFVVLIDFNDFSKIVGDNEARPSFNVGWGFLHEVDHVVNGSEDPQNTSRTAGDCEAHINQMRSEIGLPIRADYFFSPIPAGADPNFLTRLVRLSFLQSGAPKSKAKRYWLVWDATVVGGTSQERQTALVRSSK